MQQLFNKKIAFVFLLASIVLCSCDDKNNPLNTSISGYQLIFWSFLAPPRWKEEDLYKGVDLSRLQDNDPKAAELLKNMQDKWSNAPVVSILNGQKVSITGFVVPLDADKQLVNQFLLVPYFGACIHSPPPPSNQVIHVYSLPKTMVFNDDFTYIKVSGTLEVTHSNTTLGATGYKMKADFLEPIEDKVQ